MKYQHIFFDLDHTLWDFEKNSKAVLKELFETNCLAENCGIPSFENFSTSFEKHNERFWDRYRKGFIKRDELRWKRMWHTLLDYNKNDLELCYHLSNSYLKLLPHQIQLMPHALEVLDYCKLKGYQIHIITNGYESAQWHKIKSSGLEGYFGKMITSENSKSMKPKKEIFEFALNVCAAKVESSIMIGDAIEADILGAQAIGMDQVFYNYSKKNHAENPTFEINCLRELKNIL